MPRALGVDEDDVRSQTASECVGEAVERVLSARGGAERGRGGGQQTLSSRPQPIDTRSIVGEETSVPSASSAAPSPHRRPPRSSSVLISAPIDGLGGANVVSGTFSQSNNNNNVNDRPNSRSINDGSAPLQQQRPMSRSGRVGERERSANPSSLQERMARFSERTASSPTVLPRGLSSTQINGRPLFYWLRCVEGDEEPSRAAVAAAEDAERDALAIRATDALTAIRRATLREKVSAQNAAQAERDARQRRRQLQHRIHSDEEEGRIVLYLVEDRAFRELCADEQLKRARLITAARNRSTAQSPTGKVRVVLEGRLAECLRSLRVRPTKGSDRGEGKATSRHRSFRREGSASSQRSNGGGEGEGYVNAGEEGSLDGSSGGGPSAPTLETVADADRIRRLLAAKRREAFPGLTPHPEFAAASTHQHRLSSSAPITHLSSSSAAASRQPSPPPSPYRNPRLAPIGTITTTLNTSTVSASHSGATSPSPQLHNTITGSAFAYANGRKSASDRAAAERRAREQRLAKAQQAAAVSQQRDAAEERKAFEAIRRRQEDHARERVTIRERAKVAARRTAAAEKAAAFAKEAARRRAMDQLEVDEVELHISLRMRVMGESRLTALRRTLVEVPGAARVAGMSASLSISKAERELPGAANASQQSH